MRATEKCIATGDAFSLEPHGFIGATCPYVIGKHAEPYPECFGVVENALN